MIEFESDTAPIPFEQEDPALGRLVEAAMRQVLKLQAYHGYKRPRLPTYLTDRWSMEAGLGRNDRCPCGSGTKFKKCCAGT